MPLFEAFTFHFTPISTFRVGLSLQFGLCVTSPVHVPFFGHLSPLNGSFPFCSTDPLLGRSVQTITGADKTDRRRPSRTATGTDRWSRSRRAERERSSDAGAVRTSEMQSTHRCRAEPNRYDTNRANFQILNSEYGIV